MGIVDCYSVHIYCDEEECARMDDISGMNLRDCLKIAKQRGWQINLKAISSKTDYCGRGVCFCSLHKKG